MKENFDNAGVAQKVATLLALPLADRALELQVMKDNFAAWMEHHFNLQPHQVEQLNNLPAELRKQLSTAISNYLMQGYTLQFQKDQKEEDPDFKELSVHGLDQWQDDVVKVTFTPLFIRISYSDPQR
ncbi:hypothetical protein [Sphingobacterium multivorum]|uniref:hypothetical protein n=1 Tax=Sphingobacterium multivorum TaxID=28454 RepID=UPI0031BB86B0